VSNVANKIPCANAAWAVNLSKSQIQGIAEEIAKTLKYSPNESSIREIVEALGGTIKYNDFTESDQSGSMIVSDARDFTIFIKPNK